MIAHHVSLLDAIQLIQPTSHLLCDSHGLSKTNTSIHLIFCPQSPVSPSPIHFLSSSENKYWVKKRSRVVHIDDISSTIKWLKDKSSRTKSKAILLFPCNKNGWKSSCPTSSLGVQPLYLYIRGSWSFKYPFIQLTKKCIYYTFYSIFSDLLLLLVLRFCCMASGSMATN